MIDVLYGHDDAVKGFVWQVYGRQDIDFQGAKTVGVVENGSLIAGVVFHDWQPDAATIEMSVAAISRRWLRPKVIQALARYAFEAAKAQLVVMRTSERNKPACRVAEALGFTAHRIPRLRGHDEAEIIYTFPVEAWAGSRFARSR